MKTADLLLSSIDGHGPITIGSFINNRIWKKRCKLLQVWTFYLTATHIDSLHSFILPHSSKHNIHTTQWILCVHLSAWEWVLVCISMRSLIGQASSNIQELVQSPNFWVSNGSDGRPTGSSGGWVRLQHSASLCIMSSSFPFLLLQCNCSLVGMPLCNTSICVCRLKKHPEEALMRRKNIAVDLHRIICMVVLSPTCIACSAQSTYNIIFLCH